MSIIWSAVPGRCLGAFSLSAAWSGLLSFCSFLSLGFLAAQIPQSKTDPCQDLQQQWQEEVIQPLISVPCIRAAVGSWGRTALPPCSQHSLQAPSPTGQQAALGWGCRAGCVTSPMPGPFLVDGLWPVRLSCCWSVHGAWLLLVTNGCLGCCVSLPPFCF